MPEVDQPIGLLLASPAGIVLAGIWGALWGSFLNVVIHRLPRGESLVRPGSRCPACGHPIRAWDNVPVLAWLWLRGRCRDCGARISAIYPLVELLGVALALACWAHAVTWGSGPPGARLAGFFVEHAFALTLLAVAIIDLRTMIIPDRITVPMGFALLGAAVALGRVAWLDAVLGAAVGFLGVLVVAGLYRALRHREGLGLGDGKLLGLMGGFLGWQAIPAILLLGSVQGLLVAVPLVLAGRSLRARQSYHGLTDGPPGRPDGAGPPDLDDVPEGAVPFGPFLALAGLEMLWFGRPVLEAATAWLRG